MDEVDSWGALFNISLISYPITLGLLSYLVYSYFIHCPHSTQLITRWGGKLLITLTRICGSAVNNEETEETNCRLINNKYLEIKYKFGALSYVLLVPYRRGLSKRGQDVWFISEEGQQRNITHQPGVPYLVTPNDLGGKVVIKDANHRIIETFEDDQMIKCYSVRYSK